MLECKRRNLEWRWVYTAQHKETMDKTLETFGIPAPEYTIVKWQTEAKSMGKIWYWFFKMLVAVIKSRRILQGQTGKQSIVLTHGDTLTTWIAALYAKVTRTKVMHIESGLRSFNIWRPFPEEINRLITFRLSDYYACPGQWAVDNLDKYKGVKINTYENTQIDTIKFGLANADKENFVLPKEKYVVVSLHRYENIFKKERFEKIITELEFVAEHFYLLIVQHPATHLQLDKFKLRDRLEKNKKIKLLPRLEYLPFVKAIKNSEFVITDGGGNQEELYHMGKPTLIFRDETERKEGLGTTALVSKLNHHLIEEFMSQYRKYKRKPSVISKSPSEIIVDVLENAGYGQK